MTMQGRGPDSTPDPGAELRKRLSEGLRWQGDRTDRTRFADPTGWWADPWLLQRLDYPLKDLFPESTPSVVLGPQSRGALLGALVAVHLEVGLVELRKEPNPGADSDRWLITRTPPEYRDLNLEVGVRRRHLVGQRVLLVDDWIDTGGQCLAARELVEKAGAEWCGAAVVCDALQDSRLRRDLDVRSLMRLRDLR